MSNKVTLLHGDCLEKLREFPDNSVDSIVTDPPYGISFMGKKWDYDVPKVEVWKEVLRVLKPGGHALVACGTRTQHRMAVNLEDAGFEIRDIVAWVYGSGFPKSLNIGRAVDKIQGNKREEINKVFPDGSKPRQTAGHFSIGENIQRYTKYTKGNSPYEGWGTALKPAMELWTLCRKPLEEKTVAENVLKYGTGGINIDGSRVDAHEVITNHSRSSESAISKGKYGDSTQQETHQTIGQQLGRFPANLIHDGSDEVLELFPETKSGAVKNFTNNGANQPINLGGGMLKTTEGSEGSAARFFYCAKASKSERNRGLDGFEEKKVHRYSEKAQGPLPQQTPSVGVIEKNHHPTVKPVKLMQYLCRLVTPKGGTVLDPFAGSGSTGIGAKLEGFNFIGIEREEEYVKIAEARIHAWEKEPEQTTLL